MQTPGRSILAALFMLLLVTSAGANTSSYWTPEKYIKYSYQSFAKYKPAQQRINAKAIDRALLHAAIFYETNRRRALHHLPVFKHSQALEAAARDHSRDMVQRNFFSHKNPAKGKKTLKDRLRRVGITNVYMAENIAYLSVLDRNPDRALYTPEQNGGYFSYTYKGEPLRNHTYLSLAKAVVEQWMNSKGHRENILNSHYVFLGCSVAHYRDANFHNMDRFKVTQDFSSKDSNRTAK